MFRRAVSPGTMKLGKFWAEGANVFTRRLALWGTQHGIGAEVLLRGQSQVTKVSIITSGYLSAQNGLDPAKIAQECASGQSLFLNQHWEIRH